MILSDNDTLQLRMSSHLLIQYLLADPDAMSHER